MFFICHGLKLLLSKYGTLILVGENCAESFGIRKRNRMEASTRETSESLSQLVLTSF